MTVDLTSGPEVGLLNLHYFYICRHHPTLKFKPHATDDERYVWGIDGVPLRPYFWKMKSKTQDFVIPHKNHVVRECSIRFNDTFINLYMFYYDAFGFRNRDIRVNQTD